MRHRRPNSSKKDIEPVTLHSAPQPPTAPDFWREPSLEDLAAEQGVSTPQNLEQLIGAGADLWGSESQFDGFIAGIDARRKSPEAEEEAQA